MKKYYVVVASDDEKEIKIRITKSYLKFKYYFRKFEKEDYCFVTGGKATLKELLEKEFNLTIDIK